jgi:hypothetical protein
MECPSNKGETGSNASHSGWHYVSASHAETLALVGCDQSQLFLPFVFPAWQRQG